MEISAFSSREDLGYGEALEQYILGKFERARRTGRNSTSFYSWRRLGKLLGTLERARIDEWAADFCKRHAVAGGRSAGGYIFKMSEADPVLVWF